MNFKDNFNIKKIVMCLVGIMLIAYGIAAITFFTFGKFSFEEAKSNYNKFGAHGIFHLSSHDYNYHDSKTMQLDGIDEISIDLSAGNVKFNNEGTNAIKVKVDGTITSSSSTKPQLKCYKQGGILYIELIRDHGIIFGDYSQNIDVNISLPTAYRNNMKIVSSAGDVDISGYEFKALNCKLSAGSLVMNNMSADKFTYKNYAGDLKADNLKTKSSEVRASAGKIQITGFTGDIEGNNSAGDTDIQYNKFNNNIDLTATAGQIELTLPKDSKFKLDAAASVGSIESNFSGINVSGEISKSASGEIGKSNNIIKLKNTAGNIKINN
ncbi:DUF4097 family beta strand repeat-containing protein [Clostridium hydrogenum]|uniref:DUF4097 family beta strand repeat-containing protein n=1 Tax=Clostridium hydrogenum TaxID=2855764 RepID=UPI001F43BF6C|nr:DUF4097 family beta strand repeat-containing protein [Clostridium hydrogenum]